MTRRFFVSLFSALGFSGAAARVAPVAQVPAEGYGILRFKTLGDGFWFAPTLKQNGKTWILGSSSMSNQEFIEAERVYIPYNPATFVTTIDYFASTDKSVARSYLQRALNGDLPDHWRWIDASKTGIF